MAFRSSSARNDRDAAGEADVRASEPVGNPARGCTVKVPFSRLALRCGESMVDAPQHAKRIAVTDAGERDRTQRLIAARVNERLFSGSPTALRIGRFTILDELGRGGMGVVYSAYDEKLDRKVAIKVLLEDVSDRDRNRDAQRRFLWEGQAMARTSHANVVSVHEVGYSNGQPFLAMELIEGQSLLTWLRTRPGWRRIVDAFVQAGQGLIAAHRAGLVHRDLKLTNIMRSDDGVVKVLDFGLARVMGDTRVDGYQGTEVSVGGMAWSLTAPVTRAGMVVGTPPYMSPEQLSGRSVDARSDQFSFCVALYEALYGVRPFQGESLEALLREIASGTVAPAPRGSRVPAAVHKAVLRGLAHDPAKRWPSMEALLAVLRRQIAPRRAWVGPSVALCVLVSSVGLGGAHYAAWAHRCAGVESQLDDRDRLERPRHCQHHGRAPGGPARCARSPAAPAQEVLARSDATPRDCAPQSAHSEDRRHPSCPSAGSPYSRIRPMN